MSAYSSNVAALATLLPLLFLVCMQEAAKAGKAAAQATDAGLSAR
jgi:hypothetical protein